MKPELLVLERLVREGRIAEDWVEGLRVADPKIDAKVERCLAEVEMAGPYLPVADAIWRAFELPLAKVRVLILGQDPYPNPDHAVGLSFSTGPGGAIPDSLRNIFMELNRSGYRTPSDGDLSGWAQQRGVMLLNRALTLPRDPTKRPRRHLRWWRPLAVAATKALAQEAANRPVAALLWGVPAHGLRTHLGPNVRVFASSHPSPLSAARMAGAEEPFLGSEPFKKADDWFVKERKGHAVGWDLPI